MGRNKNKKGKGQFVQLNYWLLKQPAWRVLKSGPRDLYVELKMRYNGFNNGSIFLSQRDAAVALNITRETVASYFAELEAKGFILKTEGHCLGSDGRGRAAKWALTELEMDGVTATKDFLKWKK